MAEAAHDLDHLQLHAGEDEATERQADCQQQEDAALVGRRDAAGRRRGAGRRRVHRRATRQDQQMDRRAGQQMDRGIEQQGAAPASAASSTPVSGQNSVEASRR
jgi:hypothetical protein